VKTPVATTKHPRGVELSRRFAASGLRAIQEAETNMSDLRYPNESKEYREARAALLKDELELVDKVRSVADQRRRLGEN
jgi:hypothetical protein